MSESVSSGEFVPAVPIVDALEDIHARLQDVVGRLAAGEILDDETRRRVSDVLLAISNTATDVEETYVDPPPHPEEASDNPDGEDRAGHLTHRLGSTAVAQETAADEQAQELANLASDVISRFLSTGVKEIRLGFLVGGALGPNVERARFKAFVAAINNDGRLLHTGGGVYRALTEEEQAEQARLRERPDDSRLDRNLVRRAITTIVQNAAPGEIFPRTSLLTKVREAGFVFSGKEVGALYHMVAQDDRFSEDVEGNFMLREPQQDN